MKHSSFMRCYRRLLLLILTGLTGPVAWAQVPAWQHVAPIVTAPVTFSNPNISEIDAMAADDAGNVFVVGRFKGTVSFGATSLTSGGQQYVMFVAKWSSITRTYVWAQRIGSGQVGYGAPSLALRGNGVYVTAAFSGTLAFGNTTLTSAGGEDIFVAKLLDAGSTGTPVWIQGAGGSGNDRPTGLTVAHTGIYVAGVYDTAGATFGATTLPGSGFREGFVAKLADGNPTSSFIWAQRLGGSGRAGATAVAANTWGIFLAGEFSGTADFGTTTLTSIGSNDAYVAKLTDIGTSSSFAWAHRMGSTGSDLATALAIEGQNVYVAGTYSGASADIGSFTLTGTGQINGSSPSNIFITKLIDSGINSSFLWVQQTGGNAGPNAAALAARGANVYLAGWFYGNSIQFGSTVLTQSPGMPPYNDAFLAKLTERSGAATFDWAKKVGDFGTEHGTGVVISDRKVHLAGWFNSPSINFNAINLSIPGLASTGFIATLSDTTIAPLLATRHTHRELRFTLAPNPARAAATLTLPAVPGAATASLTLHDALGRAVRTATVPMSATGLRHELTLAGLPAGLYVVRVQTGAVSGTCKLLVE